jgi:uncharacterized membrane protein
MAQAKKVSKKPNQEEKIWAALSYLWILSIVALAARKKNDYIRFHANQGFLLFLCSLVWWFPFFGQILAIIIVIAAIAGIVKALQGKKWELPLVADIAKKVGDWFIKIVKL